MKRLILILAAVVLTTTAVKAQQTMTTSQQVTVTSANFEQPSLIQIPLLKNSVYAGWGFLPVTEFGSWFIGAAASVFTALNGYTFDYYDSNLSAFFGGYERYLTKWLAFGADVTYSANKLWYNPTDNKKQQDPSAQPMSIEFSYLSIMANVKAVWWSTPSFRVYSRFALGYCHIGLGDARYKDGTKVNDQSPFFPFVGMQISALGFEIGRDFAFFFEPILTAGWQGTLFTAGVKFNF